MERPTGPASPPAGLAVAGAERPESVVIPPTVREAALGQTAVTGHDPEMQSSLLSEFDQDAAALAAASAARGSSGHHDELRGVTTGSETVSPADRSGLAPLWAEFFQASGPQGWTDLAARQARVQRRVREDGATYNVYAEGGEGARTWPLELLPLLISAQEWELIERGVCQRARLMEAALADIYGPQVLLSNGLLPAPLVYGHPQYLRPMHGVKPAGDAWLHVVAVDLARGPDGHWWVVGHRCGAPSGLGYLLENRLIIAQQFPEAFREMRVQRIASAFRSLMEGLMRASPAGDRSRTVLLTPGPRNETYFEHVFLARYLGLSLVEGSDLTVREKKLYLKTLHGLERVHIVLRRVDDEWVDPLELRSDSALGVPGLVQAVRAGEVVMANVPGAGVLESPGLTAFWPGVARKLLGEELLLPATTSWWCGEDSVWAANQDKLADYIIMPSFPDGPVTRSFEPVVAANLDPATRQAWVARIQADPAAHTLMEPVRPSELPVWRDGHIEPRPVVLRVFAMLDGDGQWCMLPGGLTRVATRYVPNENLSPKVQAAAASARAQQGQAPLGGGADAYLSMQRGSASTDTWVLARGEVDALSLLPKPLKPADLAGWHRVITSRSAENLFWLGRYTERAENTLRLVRLALENLPTATAPVQEVLYRMLRRHGLIDAAVPSPALPSAHAGRVFERALVHALADPVGSTSVAYNLQALRRCAESLRERLSQEHWALILDLDQRFSRLINAVISQEGHEPLSDVLAVLAQTTTRLAAVTGAQTDRMTRDDGWRLLSVGRQIERLDMLASSLAMGFEAGLPRLDDGFAMLLGLFDSTITYRAQFQARREVPPLLHLLVLDTDNPRSLAWVARTLRDRLVKLSRHDAGWAESVCEVLPQPQGWDLAKLCERDAAGSYAELIKGLNACCAGALALSNEISRRLFSHVGPAERSVWQ
jgi:uncharacterized circularly permuted ATP-grasp superfamily protein/uncharacterized alpha-E superfamily protein